MAGYMDQVEKAKTFAEFKKLSPNTKITAAGFRDLKKRGRKKGAEKMLLEGFRTISNDEQFIKRNDGGIARKTRTF
tara:strand:- start:905 stop:1132 length:228 start_codon:yes stop_codon:yes gene_type:complete